MPTYKEFLDVLCEFAQDYQPHVFEKAIRHSKKLYEDKFLVFTLYEYMKERDENKATRVRCLKWYADESFSDGVTFEGMANKEKALHDLLFVYLHLGTEIWE